jgi:hypothetical protein
MKYLIILIFSFLLFSCSNNKRVYWCGDHACINNKEKEAYFKKTMIVEVRMLNKQNKKSKSQVEIIKKQAGLEQKKEIKNEKTLIKLTRLEEKRKIKESKKLAKQARLEEKRRFKENKKLAKQDRLKEKKLNKEKRKKTKKKVLKTKRHSVSKINISSTEFNELLKKITKKNMFRRYPNINDIPN